MVPVGAFVRSPAVTTRSKTVTRPMWIVGANAESVTSTKDVPWAAIVLAVFAVKTISAPPRPATTEFSTETKPMWTAVAMTATPVRPVGIVGAMTTATAECVPTTSVRPLPVMTA